MNPKERELLLCIPGPWRDRSDFIRAIVSETQGEFMFAGMILAHPKGNDHVPLEFAPHYPQMRRAFELAGQGKLSSQVLDQISGHSSVAYLHFPVGISSQKERLLIFTNVLQRCGGFAVKIESAGVGHDWKRWDAALTSDNPFDLYRTFVVLIGDANHCYSCGMHHFGLPDVEVERTVELNEAADLMNRFNYWQIAEKPKLASGHTFSISADAPRYRITLKNDHRHEAEDLFHNANGLWSLKRIDGSL
jgi:hypothetical protein